MELCFVKLAWNNYTAKWEPHKERHIYAKIMRTKLKLVHGPSEFFSNLAVSGNFLRQITKED